MLLLKILPIKNNAAPMCKYALTPWQLFFELNLLYNKVCTFLKLLIHPFKLISKSYLWVNIPQSMTSVLGVAISL